MAASRIREPATVASVNPCAWASSEPSRNMSFAGSRTKARAEGLWPPPGGAGTLITQATKICMPSAFSPLQ